MKAIITKFVVSCFHDWSVNSLYAGKLFVLLLTAEFFQNRLLQKKSFRGTIGVSNSLDPGFD